jgi:hypothetical protein
LEAALDKTDLIDRAKRVAKEDGSAKRELVNKVQARQRIIGATLVKRQGAIRSGNETAEQTNKGSFSKGRNFIMPGKKHSSDRELIDTGRDKRFVRRDEKGQFKESDDVGRSLARDVKQHAKTKARKGQGDRGDH